ncbi:hypothetical protein LDI01_28590 [Lentilactobacillus diolivorans]|uniref:Uncharacterized protein n=1 Tax=Lentilactobacillus diolivorans TaxID=179838 RepID=A0ABQ0XGU1_9LACO|nr:hypothetical protein LDI01_28590 [Lentilactobacillus diolivorans]
MKIKNVIIIPYMSKADPHGATLLIMGPLGTKSIHEWIKTLNHISFEIILTATNISPIAIANITCCNVPSSGCPPQKKFDKCQKPKSNEEMMPE